MVNNVNNITAANAYTYLGFLKLLLLNVVYLFPVARGISARPSERFFRLAGLPQGRQSRPSRSRSLRKRRRRRARVFVLRHNLHIRFGFIHYSFPALTKCRDALCGGVLTVQYYQLFHQRKARTSSWLDLSEPVVK